MSAVMHYSLFLTQRRKERKGRKGKREGMGVKLLIDID